MEYGFLSLQPFPEEQVFAGDGGAAFPLAAPAPSRAPAIFSVSTEPPLMVPL